MIQTVHARFEQRKKLKAPFKNIRERMNGTLVNMVQYIS